MTQNILNNIWGQKSEQTASHLPESRWVTLRVLFKKCPEGMG